MQPGQPGEVQPRIASDTPLLDGIAIGIEDWKANHTEIERVSGCPYDTGDTRFFQVEGVSVGLVESRREAQKRLFRKRQALTMDKTVDPRGQVRLKLISSSEVLVQIVREQYKVVLQFRHP